MYSDGWVEQGGNFDFGNESSGGGHQIISFPIEMLDDKYNVSFGNVRGNSNNYVGFYKGIYK